MNEKIILADVLYTKSDESYYVLEGTSKYADAYKANSMWEAFKLLREDGWEKCGKVQRSDGSIVDMFVRKDELIAIWKEAEFDDQQEVLTENVADFPINSHHEEFHYQGVPVAKKQPIYKNGKMIYTRSRKVALNALQKAGYQCEIDEKHSTFIREKDNIPYMESHHLVPMKYSDYFDVSLDVEENVVSLCSNCHNWIHYGKDAEKLLKILFEERRQLLEQAGIKITLEDLLEMYL